MNEALVTIVVPIYNVEKYLDRCMESIVNQTYQNLEIIMVDDGSPDHCPEKCEEWAQKDSRIKVIHKENAGLGMARNTGIENATGAYICFFDSDDYVALETIEKTVQLAEQDNSDVVLFGMSSVDSKGKVQQVYCPYTEKTVYSDAEIVDFILPNMIEGSAKRGKNYNLNMSACSALFSMKIIAEHNWKFVSERQYISEDFYSLLNLYQYVHKVSVLKMACYFYCFNQTSLTRSYNPDRYKRIYLCYDAMMDMCITLNYPDKISQCLATQFLGNVIGAMKLIVTADGCFADKRKALLEVVEEKHLHASIKKVDLKKESITRKMLIFAIKNKLIIPLYMMLKAKIRGNSR